jgi:hypothetical protein
MGNFAEIGALWTILCFVALTRFIIRHWRGIGIVLITYFIIGSLVMAFHRLWVLL